MRWLCRSPALDYERGYSPDVVAIYEAWLRGEYAPNAADPDVRCPNPHCDNGRLRDAPNVGCAICAGGAL